jgi:tetratricopeptide (TPR) repeat protein
MPKKTIPDHCRRVVIAVFFWLSCSALLQARHFEFTPMARQAYNKAISLRFGEAYNLMAQMRLKDPDNLIVYHLENYIDFFKVYIHENEAEYRELKKKVDARLEAIAEGDPSSPYYLFVQADIRLQWALVKLRFEDYVGAFTDVSKAHKLLQANEEAFPDFILNKKDLGILHAMVGTIPDSYKWGVKLLGGLEGTIEQGKREIEAVLEHARHHDFIFEQETHVLYAFLLLHLDNKEKAAWQAVQRAGLTPASNPLHCFVMANIAMRTGKNETAIQLLQNRPARGGIIDFPYLDYMLGLAKLRRLDADAAPYFHSYLKNYQGRNFVKEAYQKLAWQSLINEDLPGYKRYMEQCLSEGHSIAGGDKNAQREAREGTPPNLLLLKARLLFDGAYFSKGYELLQSAGAAAFSGKDELEYYYRLGRLYHGQKQYERALQYYTRTIEKGQDSKYYYACNAALQKGMIYEQQQQKQKAIQAYEQCLELKPSEYRLGLHQKAKAGLARISK